MSNDIFDFFNGLKGSKTGEIKIGDTCYHIDTKKRSKCLKIVDGLYFGRTADKQIEVGLIQNFRKV